MSIETAKEQLDAVRIIRVRELAVRALQAISDETHTEIVVMALIEASVRVIQAGAGLDSIAASKEFARIVDEIAQAEAGN